MTRSRIVAALIALAAIGVGGYFVFRYLNKPLEKDTTNNPGEATPRGHSVDVPSLRFTDVTDQSGIRFQHYNAATPQKLLPETMSGGVAVFDFDGDGKPDVLFINGRPWPGQPYPPEGPPTMKLYRNKGGFQFEDVTEQVGLNVPIYGMGVTVGDFDNDGRPDIFVSCVGKHHLFRNVDGKRFEDVTDTAFASGVLGPDIPNVGKDEFLKWKPPIPLGSSCTFLDYDGDGRLDLFVCHYVSWSPGIDLSVNSTLTGGGRTYQQPQQLEGSQCSLYRNVDGKRFEEVTATAGIRVISKEGTETNARERAVGKSLGVIVCDPDGDGWPDIFVANDTVRNFFFHNEAGPDGKRVYKEVGVQAGAAYADEGRVRGGMGIDWGEFALGRSACVVANFANEPLTFLEKDRGQRLLFSDNAQGVGLTGPTRLPLKFGTFYFDADNDGRLDLLVNNGHIDPDIGRIQEKQQYSQAPQFYWNTGNSECYYEPVREDKAGPDLFKPLVGRGSAFVDLDGDGFPDVILAANGGPPRILRNDAPKGNHWIRLDLRGDGKTANRSAIGASITMESGGQTYHRTVTAGRGYLSQSELVVTVGLGVTAKVDKVTVKWPGKDAGMQTWTSLDVDKAHVLKQSEAR
jgi:enediyne biosynthesis protein E4